MNSVPEAISDLSSLTRVQLETLKIHYAIRNSEINMQDALKKRKNSGISRGTHYRILGQARRNVLQSLFTVAVGVKMGLLKPEDLQKLISTISLIPEDVDQEKLPEVVALLRALADRIVML